MLSFIYVVALGRKLSLIRSARCLHALYPACKPPIICAFPSFSSNQPNADPDKSQSGGDRVAAVVSCVRLNSGAVDSGAYANNVLEQALLYD
jgi:hypothetical protein